MMQQSEITINNQSVIDTSDQSINHGQTYQDGTKSGQHYHDGHVPEWNGQPPAHWKAWGFVESEISTNESIETTKCKRRCNRVCKNILCAFLLLSFIIAAVAATGLTIYLTQFSNKLTNNKTDHPTHGGPYEDVDLSTVQQTELTKIFCGTIEELLLKTKFPVENGLKECYASILYVEKTGSIHIQMHATPVKGYTIKEKIIRALTEQTFNTSDNRIEETSQSSTDKSVSKDSSTSTVITWATKEAPTEGAKELTKTTADRNVDNSRTDDISTTTDGWWFETTTESTPLPTHFSTQSSSTTTTPKTTTTTKPTTTTTATTTTPKPTTTTPKPTATTTMSKPTTTTTTTSKPTTTTTTTPKTTTTTLTTTEQPQTTTTITSKDLTTEQQVSGNRFSDFKVPVRTNLFQHSFNEPMSDNTVDNTLNSVPVKKSSSPKVVESLMAGGVIRLPLRTNSNFRFLFSGNSKSANQDSPRTEVKVATRRPSL